MTEAYSGREGPESFFPQGNGKKRGGLVSNASGFYLRANITEINATELRAIPSNFLALCFNF